METEYAPFLISSHCDTYSILKVRTAACFQILMTESLYQCLEEIKELLSTLVIKI